MHSVAYCAAKILGGENMWLKLPGLEISDNIMLFNHHAFFNLKCQDSDLQSIGVQIAKKLRGYPLVTRVVGAHLHDKMDIQYWHKFLHEKLAHFEGNAADVIDVLKLSYYHLPTELQACFRYCSMLPRGCEMEKEELLDMWICSGLISQGVDSKVHRISCSQGKRSLQDIGEDYVIQLTKKSFLDLKFRKNNLGIVIEESGYYVMHDLMYDLAKYFSSGECAQVVDAGSIENLMGTVRHIRIDYISSIHLEEIKKITNLKNLRTIIISGHREEIKKDILNAVEELVQSSKSLRLFQSELCHTSHFLRKVSRLRHLRFIILQLMSAKSLHGIFKLYHLEVLELHCNDVIIGPKLIRDLGNLDRLRYVVCQSAGFVNYPIGRLTSLRVLQGYEVQKARGYTISSLKDLKIIRRLAVKGLENVENPNEARDAKLKEKQELTSLFLEWSEYDGGQSATNESILENLEPHANIKEIQILGYNGIRVPHWIANPPLRSLCVLELKSCTNLVELPSLADLKLEHIELKNLPRLTKMGQTTNASNSACLELSFSPNLRTLVVINCPELQELPLLPSSLVSLEITLVGLNKLPKIGKPQTQIVNDLMQLSQLLHISINKCPSLTSLEGSLLEQKQYLGVLEELKIERCMHLQHASVTFEEMKQLRILHIGNCPEMNTSGLRLLPLSIRKLHISRCGSMAVALLQSIDRLSNLTTLRLEHCSGITSLPGSDLFMSLKTLKSIVITGCEDLTSLGGLGYCSTLVSLRISCCNKLVEVNSSQTPSAYVSQHEGLMVPRNSLQLCILEIDVPSLLLVEPLKNLYHTEQLSITDATEMESLPEEWLLQNRAYLRYFYINNAKCLVSLQPSIQDLSSLKKLSIVCSEQLQSLPPLPMSMQELIVFICNPELERKCKEQGSSEWRNITMIPRVRIGHLCFIMGKECSKKTCSMLWDEDSDTLSSWANQQEGDGSGVESALQEWKKLCCLAPLMRWLSSSAGRLPA